MGSQPAPTPAIPSMFGSGAWCPPYTAPQSTAPSSAVNWLAGLQQPDIVSLSMAEGSWWAPVGDGAPTIEYPDVQAWGVNSHPLGGYLDYLKKNSTTHDQVVSNGSSFQPINVGDETNSSDCGRTEKHMLWTKDEDCRLVGAWVN